MAKEKRTGGKKRTNFRKHARNVKIFAQAPSQGLVPLEGACLTGWGNLSVVPVWQREDGGNATAPFP